MTLLRGKRLSDHACYRYACPKCGQKWRFNELVNGPRVPGHRDGLVVCPGSGKELVKAKREIHS